MDKINDSRGYLVLKPDGAVLESGGDLENDEDSANIFMNLLNLTETIDENFMTKNSCERISIVYEDHTYNICMSNRRICILKLSGGSSSDGNTAVLNNGARNPYVDENNTMNPSNTILA